MPTPTEIAQAGDRLIAVFQVMNGGVGDGYLGIVDAIEILDLSPAECTEDVLRALWVIVDEFDVQPPGDHWATDLFEYVDAKVYPTP